MPFEVLDDGHLSVISFAGVSELEFFQIENTPIGLEGGGKIETVHQQLVRYRTASPKKLISVTDKTILVSYDPKCIAQIVSLMQANKLISQMFPDLSKWNVWGWLESFKPGRLIETDRATAQILIMASNKNDTGVETGPAYVAPPP